MAAKFKYWLFGVFALILFLPMLQHKLQFIKSGKLQGIFTDAPDTSFTLNGWWNGSYQPVKEKYLNDNTGFRPDLVRLTCQLDFSFFDICHAGWDELGKDYHLFQYPYIQAYYGQDFVGYDSILQRCLKLRALQDTFAKMCKSLIIVYAASKASSYPEYFPNHRVRPKRDSTNHDVYRHLCDSLGINQLDMDEWFVSMKNKSKESLFSKQGIHWTYYGALLASDSLMHYVERLRHLTLTHPVWRRIEYAEPKEGDNDLSISLNLIAKYPREILAYPVVEDLPADTSRKLLNGIFLGDSYCQKMVTAGIISRMNRRCEFWSYFNSAHDINSGAFSMMKDYNWKAAIDSADYMVIEYTAFNFPQLGNGFIEQAYDHYFPKRSGK
jgi:hypothetical protein